MKRGIPDDGLKRIASKVAQDVRQPRDDPSVDTVDAIRSFMSRMQNILEIAEGEEQQESVFAPYQDEPDFFDREGAVRDLLTELAQDILNMRFLKDPEMTTKTRIE